MVSLPMTAPSPAPTAIPTTAMKKTARPAAPEHAQFAPAPPSAGWCGLGTRRPHPGRPSTPSRAPRPCRPSSSAATSPASASHLTHGGAEGLEGLAGRVEVGILAQGLADAVTVESLPHRAEDAAERQVHVMLVNVLGDLGQDGGRGVVDIPDGGAVDDHPAQRAAVADQP